jgi:hypothetical protein
MPDGFEPHMELSRTINLAELMTECRKPALQIVSMALEIALNTENHPDTRLRAGKMLWDRGFGETIKQMNLNIGEERNRVDKRVVILPSNGREDAIHGPVIDVEA